MTKLIIHCGAHKTATSSIQQLLATSQGTLRDARVNYLRPELINGTGVLPSMAARESDRTGVKKLRELFLSARKGRGDSHWIAEPDRVLISHESILSFVGLSPKSSHFYPSIERSAETLHECGINEIFDSVELIFFVRRQDHFVVSLYLQHLSRAAWRDSFEEVFPQLDVSQIDWHSTARRIEGAFPDSRLSIRPFEILKARGEEAFLDSFMELAIGRTEPAFKKLPRVNESFSRRAYEIATRYYRILDRESALLLAQTLSKVFPASRFGKPALMTKEQSSKVMRAVRQANVSLFQDYLSDFGDFEDEYVIDANGRG